MKYGELLKQITESVKEENELEDLKSYFMVAAKEGRDSTSIAQLEQRFPILYTTGRLWDWLRNNEIGFSGGANSDGKNANYLFWW